MTWKIQIKIKNFVNISLTSTSAAEYYYDLKYWDIEEHKSEKSHTFSWKSLGIHFSKPTRLTIMITLENAQVLQLFTKLEAQQGT